MNYDGALRYDAWREMLPSSDPHYDFLINGIKDGFHILDSSQLHDPVEQQNYQSATSLITHVYF